MNFITENWKLLIGFGIVIAVLIIYASIKVASDADDAMLGDSQYHNDCPDKIEPTKQEVKCQICGEWFGNKDCSDCKNK